MTIESRAAATDLRALLNEIHPHRNYDHKDFDESLLASIALNRREMQMLRNDFKTFTKLKAAYAEGTEPRVTVKPRGRKGSTE